MASATANSDYSETSMRPVSQAEINSLLSIITLQLGDFNFLRWNYQFQSTLEGHDLFGYFDGFGASPVSFVVDSTCLVTSEVTAAYKQLKRVDRALESLLMTTLYEDTMDIIGCRSSYEAWTAIQERYSSVSRDSIMQLRTDLQTIKKGSDSIVKYFMCIKHARDELNSVGVPLSGEEFVFPYQLVPTNITGHLKSMQFSAKKSVPIRPAYFNSSVFGYDNGINGDATRQCRDDVDVPMPPILNSSSFETGACSNGTKDAEQCVDDATRLMPITALASSLVNIDKAAAVLEDTRGTKINETSIFSTDNIAAGNLAPANVSGHVNHVNSSTKKPVAARPVVFNSSNCERGECSTGVLCNGDTNHEVSIITFDDAQTKARFYTSVFFGDMQDGGVGLTIDPHGGVITRAKGNVQAGGAIPKSHIGVTTPARRNIVHIRTMENVDHGIYIYYPVLLILLTCQLQRLISLLVEVLFPFTQDVALDHNSHSMTTRATNGIFILKKFEEVLWQSKKQGSVSRSFTEAEYRALANTAADVSWLRHVLCDLQVVIPAPPLLKCDNLSALALCSNPVFHSRIKHLDNDFHFVRERVQRGDLQLQYVPSEEQTADVFTKGLHSPLFKVHCSNLSLTSLAEIEGE